MTIPQGTLLGHYEIRSKLGAGGMGEIYVAKDTRLGRQVALKLLLSGLTQDNNQLNRFIQEALATSALNHPNIITIYEAGHKDTTHFIAMELVDGVTLRQHMAPTPLKIAEALNIAIQIVNALAAAHEAGITHRDIKPNNVMLRRDGYVKVLDFGLAKLTQRASVMDIEDPTRPLVQTEPDIVVGTVNYMSPEQARGLAVDARTDLWSLGCVLYEMVVGHRPFEGATPNDVIVQILEHEPPPLTHYVSEAPEALEWIVTKALTRDCELRYQTAKEMRADLEKLRRRLELDTEKAVHSTRPLPVEEPLATGAKRRKRGLLLYMSAIVIAITAVALA